jgi:2-methylisocitrate lyase-like PEP mutase family enzyme
MLRTEETPSFRTLFSQGQVLAPGVWDCFSARAAALSGFKAIMLSGSFTGFSQSGFPDIGLHNQEELVWAVERITDFSPLPLMVDADDGFGDAINAYRTCRRLAKAGAKALTLEDTTNRRGAWRFVPQMRAAAQAGGIDGNVPHEALDRKAWLSKISAALEATADTDCLVIARTESKLGVGFEEAIERCLLATELGAEMTYIHGLGTLDECRRVAEVLPGWKMFGNVGTRGGVPTVTLDELAPLGFNLVTMHIFEKAAVYGMYDVGSHVLADRTTRYADEQAVGDLARDQAQLLHADPEVWLGTEQRWAAQAEDVARGRSSDPSRLAGN